MNGNRWHRTAKCVRYNIEHDPEAQYFYKEHQKF